MPRVPCMKFDTAKENFPLAWRVMMSLSLHPLRSEAVVVMETDSLRGTWFFKCQLPGREEQSSV